MSFILVFFTTLDKKEHAADAWNPNLVISRNHGAWFADPRVYATCDGHDFTHRCIVVKSDCRFLDITWCIDHDGSFLSREVGLRIIIPNCKGECKLNLFQVEIELSTSWKPAGNTPWCVLFPKGASCKKECQQLLRKVCCKGRRASEPCNCKQDNGNDPGLN